MFFKTVEDMVYPEGITCISCGAELNESAGYSVCANCLRNVNLKFCLSCGRGIGDESQYCGFCKERGYSFTTARAPFLYKDDVVKLVYRVKFGGEKRLCAYMAGFIADVVKISDIASDVIVYAPMHKRRLRERGYNQAKEIAKSLSVLVGLPLVEDALEKTVYTKSLARMSGRERSAALLDAIAPNMAKKDEIKDKNVLLVDDVFTTGATAEACASALLKLKPNSVDVVTFATGEVKPILY